MRKFVTTIAFTAGAASAAFCVGAALHAGDDDAESAKIAKEALDKAVAHGNELFHSGSLGKKSCAACHENADKPELNLGTRAFNYPAYSRKAKAVVSLSQKINEMLTTKSGAQKAMDLSGSDVVAIEAYIGSLKKK